MLCTPKNSLGWRPPRPNEVNSVMVSRWTMRTRSFCPSVMYMKRCSGSLEKAISQVEPEANVFLAKNCSFTNVPSVWNTCTRSCCRSQT